MQQFEYKILRLPKKSVWAYKIDYESFEKELNELGKKGWEVVTSTNSNMYENKFTGVFIILKKTF